MCLPEKSKPMVQWETDLDSSFTSEEWKTTIDNLLKCTRSISSRESAVKLHTRWYMRPPLKIHSFYPSPLAVIEDVLIRAPFYTSFGAIKLFNLCGNRQPEKLHN